MHLSRVREWYSTRKEIKENKLQYAQGFPVAHVVLMNWITIRGQMAMRLDYIGASCSYVLLGRANLYQLNKRNQPIVGIVLCHANPHNWDGRRARWSLLGDDKKEKEEKLQRKTDGDGLHIYLCHAIDVRSKRSQPRSPTPTKLGKPLLTRRDNEEDGGSCCVIGYKHTALARCNVHRCKYPSYAKEP